jgi:hypothetical protein
MYALMYLQITALPELLITHITGILLNISIWKLLVKKQENVRINLNRKKNEYESKYK